MGRSNVNTVQVGQDTKISLLSQTHGRMRVPLAQTFVITPKMNAGVVGEFDNRFPVTGYGTYEGCSVSFEHHQGDIGDVNAMLMDSNPSGPLQSMIEAVAAECVSCCWVNYYSPQLGYQYGFDYVSQIRLQSNPNNQSTKDPTKVTKTFEGLVHVGVIGKTGQKAALQLVRFTASPVNYATADDVALTGSTGTFPNAPVAIPLPAEANLGAGQIYVDAYKINPAAGVMKTQLNGNSNNGTVDFTITGSTFTLAVAPTAGDVYEILVAVQPSTPIS